MRRRACLVVSLVLIPLLSRVLIGRGSTQEFDSGIMKLTAELIASNNFERERFFSRLREFKDPAATAIDVLRHSGYLPDLLYSKQFLIDNYASDPRTEPALKEFARGIVKWYPIQADDPYIWSGPVENGAKMNAIREIYETGERDLKKVIDITFPHATQAAKIVAIIHSHPDKKERDAWVLKYQEMVRLMLKRVSDVRSRDRIIEKIPFECAELCKRVDALIEDRVLREDDE